MLNINERFFQRNKMGESFRGYRYNSIFIYIPACHRLPLSKQVGTMVLIAEIKHRLTSISTQHENPIHVQHLFLYLFIPGMDFYDKLKEIQNCADNDRLVE